MNCRDYLQEAAQKLIRLHDEKRTSEVISERTALIDSLLKSLYEEALVEGKDILKDAKVVLVAQGGYGRQELCLHSDIDLLLLYQGKSRDFIPFLHAKIIQPLWDAGLELGFVTRTMRDCRQLMEEDLTILTSLLDARFLTGDHGLYEEFQKMFERYFASSKNRERFVSRKLEENLDRISKYGGSGSLLEPYLKEGEGGLRDYHSLFWLARLSDNVRTPQELASRGFLSPEEFRQLWNSLEFLWTIRNELHRRTGRRMDQLVVEYQEPIAQWMGFQTTAEFLGVELFMQKYFQCAATIHQLTEKAVRRFRRSEPSLFPPPKAPIEDPNLKVVDGFLAATSSDLFLKEPLYLLKIYEASHRLGLEVDALTKERIEKSLSVIDENFRQQKEATQIFRRLMSQPVGLGKVLTDMNERGVLGAYLPEFQKLRFRVQHDLYHVYTVDVHSIFAVTELGKLLQGDYQERHPTLSQVIRDIERKDILSFGILYHDIGKGEGKGHVEKGAPIIRSSAARLGFSPADQDVLEFLERSHLIMTHIAFRRDLEEQNLVIQFAKAMQSLELLNMLYILTFCDVKAVSPEAMTDWKASLLEYLYLKTREVLQKGSFTKEKVSTLLPKILEDVSQRFSSPEEKQKCREFFAMMAPRYLLATPAAAIVRHIQLWEKFDNDPIVFHVQPFDNLDEVTLLTWESSSLFSRLCGLFAAYNVNILDAQLNLSSKGHALHIFRVTDADGKSIRDGEKWKRIENDLKQVLEGRIPIERLVSEKFKPSLFKQKIAQKRPARVDIDNDVSPYYTVIDIYAHDRVGLLYQITSTLSALNLYVDVSKISTKVDQVADTFYVKDIFGHKITSQEKLEKVRQALLKVIEEEPTPDWKPLR